LFHLTFDTSVSDIVTESNNESLDPKHPTSDGSSVPNPLAAGETAAVASEVNGQISPMGDEGLPEWEPLTPELVEDEAIRGDFVLRWVVVGLALLLGISQISESRTLLHLKNGEYLLSHGLVPGAKDPFTSTASDRKWVNLSWLFDIASSGVYTLTGGVGLSIVQGLLAAIAFGLITHAVRPNIRTWWGSLCAILALLACYLQFTIQPELITLLGLSFLLWVLVQSEESGQSSLLWRLVPIVWLWGQFDQRAWLGVFLLLIWAAGEKLSRGTTNSLEKSPIGIVAVLSLLLMAVHPFGWEAWLAPVRMYLTDYPAIQFAYQAPSVIDQGFYPIWGPVIWKTVSHRLIAALVLASLTFMTLILNRSRARWAYLLVFLGFNGLSCLGTHELAAASLVNCVLCTINGQTWFRERYGQVYSVDWLELLFSRGGRAVTVLGCFALAWLILSGRLDGPGGKRTGVGFDSHLASAMNDYQKTNVDLVDDKPFNYSMRQGDLMIWGGLKPFIDSRAGLFSGVGSANLLEIHQKTRRALQQKREKFEGSGEPTVWKETFDKYGIRQAWPRLNGPNPPPDYLSFFDLMSSTEFEINNLNSVTAIFIRKQDSDPTAITYLKEHPYDFVQQAFRGKQSKMEDLTREWSKPATTYDNLFSLRRPIVPGGVQAAQHFLELAATGVGLPNSQRCGCAVLAIQHANEGLKDEPNSAMGYRVLGMSYNILGQLESFVLKQGGSPEIPNRVRYLQSVSALQQAARLQPNDVSLIQQLIQQYQSVGQLDSQLDLFQKWRRLRPFSKSLTVDQKQERDMVMDMIVRMEEPVARLESEVAKLLGEGVDRTQIAVGAYQAGCLLRAIKTLEEDAIYLEKNPQSKLLLARWLTEAGRGQDAESIFEGLEVMAAENALPGWRDSAAISAMTVANYLRTIKMWGDQLHETTSSQVTPAMFTLPFLTLNPLWMGPDSYPAANVGAMAQVVQGVRLEGATLIYHIAMAQMEAGAIEDAGNSIRQAIQLNPSSPLRPLLRFYLECLTGEQIEPTAPVVEVEELTDLTLPESTDNAIPKEVDKEKAADKKQESK
jgi:tetratricopeptide (TPR) repeat protein